MYRHISICCLLLALVSLCCGCNRSPSIDKIETVQPGTPDTGAVTFDIEPAENPDNSFQFLATYKSGGKTAKFLVKFDKPKQENTQEINVPIAFGKGEFIPIAGSDSTVLLADLKQALEADKLPPSPKRLKTLPFTYVSFGDKWSLAEGGGFNTKPEGNWTSNKIFIGEGEKEGQVFLNYNKVEKKGQFSIKDADYGDLVLGYLAQVL